MMKIKMMLSALIFAGSFVAFSAEFYPSKNILVVGNPGVGKSAILNGLGKKEVFESGVSFDGTGITKEMQRFKHGDVTFIDTPGLDEDSLEDRQRAAFQIEAALRLGGTYHLCFVITLEGGRIKPMDKLTIETVTGAIGHEEIKYSVIINKCENRLLEAHARHEDYRLLLQLNAEMKHKFSSVYYLPFQGFDLELLSVNQAFEQWIYDQSRFMAIKPSDIKSIILNETMRAAKIAKFEAEIRELKNLTEAQAKEFAKIQEEQRAERQRAFDKHARGTELFTNEYRSACSQIMDKIESPNKKLNEIQPVFQIKVCHKDLMGLENSLKNLKHVWVEAERDGETIDLMSFEAADDQQNVASIIAGDNVSSSLKRAVVVNAEIQCEVVYSSGDHADYKNKWSLMEDVFNQNRFYNLYTNNCSKVTKEACEKAGFIFPYSELNNLELETIFSIRDSIENPNVFSIARAGFRVMSTALDLDGQREASAVLQEISNIFQ